MKLTLDVQRWEKYKKFFNLKFVMYLVTWFALVPVIASILKDSPDKILVVSTVPHLEIYLKLPFSWQLLWFSSLSFFVAYLLYVLFVPDFIKDNNSFEEYKQYGHSPRNLVWKALPIIETDKFIQRMLEKNYIKKITKDEFDSNSKHENPYVSKEQTYYTWEKNNEYYIFGMPIKENSEGLSEKEVFWEIFGRFSEKNIYARKCISILLTINLYMFGFVLIQHIDAGLDYTLGNFWTSWDIWDLINKKYQDILK